MTPTNQLRFVQRPAFEPDGPPFIRVLQQWWDAEGDEREDIVAAGGEWLDVPLEGEK